MHPALLQLHIGLMWLQMLGPGTSNVPHGPTLRGGRKTRRGRKPSNRHARRTRH